MLRDFLGTDEALAGIHTFYRCHDRLLAHKRAVFDHLFGRWRNLCNASFDVVLYDFDEYPLEANPQFPENDKGCFGYSRDRRSVQAVIALIVTLAGLPLAYEVLSGNTADSAHSRGFLERIEPPVPQGAGRLDDGPRHSHRGRDRGDARGRSAPVLPGSCRRDGGSGWFTAVQDLNKRLPGSTIPAE